LGDGRNARGVDEAVEAAQVADRGLNNGSACVRIGDIAGHRVRSSLGFVAELLEERHPAGRDD
jgi:hypothetical protein